MELYKITEDVGQGDDPWTILRFDGGDFQDQRRVQTGDRLQFLNAVKSMTDSYIAFLAVNGEWS